MAYNGRNAQEVTDYMMVLNRGQRVRKFHKDKTHKGSKTIAKGYATFKRFRTCAMCLPMCVKDTRYANNGSIKCGKDLQRPGTVQNALKESAICAVGLQIVKGSTSWFVYLEKSSLMFSNSSFVKSVLTILVPIWLLLSLWCFSVSKHRKIQVFFNLKVILTCL